MAKRPTLSDITSLTNSSNINVINQNWDAIQEAFDNTLSRDGSIPNTMSGDIDLNGNAILNVGTIDTNNLTLEGQQITDIASVPEWRSSWLTGTSYVKNDLVKEAGIVYICLVPHTSGTFSTDLTAVKWEVMVTKGDSGAGTGDLLASNNLSDVANAATARANLSAQASSSILTAESALSPSADQLSYFTGASTKALTNLNAAGRSYLAGTISSSFTAGTDAQGQAPIPSTDRVVVITTTAANPSGVTLPSLSAGEVGKQIVIFNRGTNTVKVYPSSGTSLQVGTADVPLKLSIGFVMRLEQRSATQWLCSIQPASFDSAGRVVGTNSTGDALAWVDGARVLLASKVAAASATLDFTEFNNSSYRFYEFSFEDVKPATDAANLLVRFSTDAGVTYDSGAGAYNYAVTGLSSGGSAVTENSSSATFMQITGGLGNDTTEFGVCGSMKLYEADNASSRTRLIASLSYDSTTSNSCIVHSTGRRLATQNTDALRFLMSSGNIASGVIRMYGLAS